MKAASSFAQRHRIRTFSRAFWLAAGVAAALACRADRATKPATSAAVTHVRGDDLVPRPRPAAASAPLSADFYVSMDGRDDWQGLLPEPTPAKSDGPFATLERARDAVRRLLAERRRSHVTVLIRGGTYVLRETVVFGLADSAPEAGEVVYAAFPGETPVFSSAVKLGPWRKTERPPAGLPARARDHVWVADVPPGVSRFFTLYDGPVRLPRARSDGMNPVAGSEDRERSSRLELHFPTGAIKNWPNLDDVEIVIRPQVQFTMNILGFETVDESRSVARTSVPASAPMTRPRMWRLYRREPDTLWVENALEVLDEPGEWVLNSHARLVYYWPKSGTPGDRVAAPALREFVRLEGRVDAAASEDIPVRNVTLRGLTFTQGDRDLWTSSEAGLQHDWEMFDKANALVRLRGAAGCAVEDCRFTDSGGTAIRLDLHCQRIRIAGNDIERLGGSGIVLCGYGPGTKDVNRDNQIVNNHIRRCGEIYWQSPGIMVWQSGRNQVAHNLIHELPSNGIVVSGVRPVFFERANRDRRECARTIRWHEVGGARTWDEVRPFMHARGNVVEYNEVHHVNQMMGDVNGIYLSGAGEGNIVRRNYVHDLLGEASHSAIRTDGWQRGTLIAENIIHRCRRGGITRKNANDVVNNIIADILEDPDDSAPETWGWIQFRSFPGEVEIAERPRVRNNILYCSGPRAVFYAAIKRGVTPQGCDADHNLFYTAGAPDDGATSLRKLQASGIEEHSVCADPLFVDPKRGNFRLAPDSPAIRLGFRPIDPSRIGLKQARDDSR